MKHLSVRYMEAFRTSPDSLPNIRGLREVRTLGRSTAADVQIARFARRPRSTETHIHANRSIVPCVSRGVRQTACAKHAHPIRTARTRAADRWSKLLREAVASRRVTISHVRTRYMRAAAPLDHRMEPSDGLHRATALRLPLRLAQRCHRKSKLNGLRSSSIRRM